MIQAGHLTLREITTYRGGETIYIGSRNSERMFRVYDKHAESKGLYPTGTWRWEIEYKGARALSLALRLRATDFSTASIMDAIVGAFMTVGVRTPVGTVPQNFRDSAPIEPTNDQKRLEWLSVQVKPSIERLLDHMDPLQVLDALGLGNYYPPQMEGGEEVK